VLELRDIEKPVAGDDDLLIQVHAAGVDPGVWHLMTGLPYLVRIMGVGFSTWWLPCSSVEKLIDYAALR
jgi:NADPH:quinone reductase-like Zn-dependent oxidoreductase